MSEPTQVPPPTSPPPPEDAALNAPFSPPTPPQPGTPPAQSATPTQPAQPVMQLRPQRGAPMWFVVTAVSLLLGVLAVQVGMMLVASAELGDQRSQNAELREDLREASSELEELEKVIKSYDDRILRVEGRTSGLLNAAEVAKNVLPSVFRVESRTGTGTAFALGREPMNGGTRLVTNYHVVKKDVEENEDTVTIVQSEREYQAKIIDTNATEDIAILETPRSFDRLSTTTKQVESGDPVVVAGAPLGLSDTVTTGVVSAVRQEGRTEVIQFDAAISPGNSGGPVVNADGEVVGIATAKIVQEGAAGIGFAVPVQIACALRIDC